MGRKQKRSRSKVSKESTEKPESNEETSIVVPDSVLDMVEQTGLFSDDEHDVEMGLDEAAANVEEIVAKIGPKSGTVVYVGHIPFGLFEQELFDFFSQFGSVQKIRLSRNPKVCFVQ
jgi:RNA recognition motif-containing protein